MKVHAEFGRPYNIDGIGLFLYRTDGVRSQYARLNEGRLEWVDHVPYAQTEPVLMVEREVYEALVKSVLVDKYGALPHDQLLRERLDIETQRVDKLLEVLTR